MCAATSDNSAVGKKLERLEAELAALGDVVVAFSGGVDSSAVLAVAAKVLGDRCVAVTGVSFALAEVQLEQARRVAKAIGVRHVLLDTDELRKSGYVANSPDRCFFCKDELYSVLEHWKTGDVAIVDGTNHDDIRDLRPGRRAAALHGVKSPLVVAEMTKADVREVSRLYGLETAEMPASPCLASRIRYGVSVTPERLSLIETAEAAVRALGYREFRVRHLGDGARIEIAADELPRALDPLGRRNVETAVRSAGFDRVTLDETPLRSGRMNEEIADGRRA